MPAKKKRGPYNTLPRKLLDILAVGGARKVAILRAWARSESYGDRQFDHAVHRLKQEGKIKELRRYGGLHYDAAHSQRGFAGLNLIQIITGLGAAAALAGTVWGAIAWHASTHYERGVQAERTAQNKKEEERRQAQRRRDDEVAAALLLEQQQRQAAEVVAEESNRRWREAQRDADRRKVALAHCEAGPAQSDGGGVVGAAAGPVVSPGGEGPAAPPAGGGITRPAAHPGVRFTFEFVRQYDSAWTGLDGKPLPQALGGGEGAEHAGASPYTPADVIDVHGENAQACSADRRELDKLISKIAAAAAAYDRGSK
jgi:hypothetical protein